MQHDAAGGDTRRDKCHYVQQKGDRVGCMGRYVTAEGWIVADGVYGKRAYRAYMPHPLAGWSPSVSADMMSSLNSASGALASLASRRSGTAGLGEWMTARDESIRSSAIEGVRSTAAGLAWAHYRDAAGLPVSDNNDALTLGASRQVDAAVGLGRQMRSGHRCSLDDVLALHQTLFSGTRDEPIGGHLRDCPMWVGPISAPISAATFVAPPQEAVPELIEDLIDYINGSDHPPVIQAAVAHVQFETIHPFEDGNGRTGRAVIQTVLNARSAVDGSVPVSAALNTDTRLYYSALRSAQKVVCARGDHAERDTALLPWLDLFRGACETAVRESLAVSDAIESVAAGWRRRIRARAGSSTRALMDALPSMPVFDVNSAAQRLAVSNRSARRAIETLEAAGIAASSGTRRNRRYRADEMIDVLRRVTPDGGRSPGWHGDEPPIPPSPPSLLCSHLGVRSKRRCVLAYGHAGDHRYKR